MKQIYLLILAVGLLSKVSGQMPDWQWAVHGGSALAGPSSVDDDIVSDMVTDSNGNTYVYAQVVQFAQFDTFEMPGYGQMDHALVKYNCNGDMEWVRFMGGSANARAGGVAIGTDDNIYLNGMADGGGTMNWDWHWHDTIIQIQASYFQVSFDPAGNRKGLFTGALYVGGVGLDLVSGEDGFLYSLGYGSGGNFAPGHQIDTGIFLMKIDTIFNVNWVKTIIAGTTINGTGGVTSSSVSLESDKSGNLYVAGTYKDSMTIGGVTIYANNWSSQSGFIAKFTNQGGFIWVKEVKSSLGGIINDIAVGSDGLYVCGFGTDSLIIGADTFQYDKGISGPFIAKFDLDGNGVWGRQGQAKYGDGAWGISLSPNEERLWVTGSAKDSLYFNNILITSNQIQDPFLVQYDSSGNVLFGTNLSSSGAYEDFGYLVSTDPNGNAYVSGTFEQTFMTGDTFPSYGGKRDIFLVKYGVEVCTDTSSGGVGLAAEAAEIFKIYPSPATSSVYLTFEEKPQLVQVYDFNGRLVAAFDKDQVSNSHVELDISTWATGLYLVSVTGEEGRSAVRKLVKME